MGKKVLLNRGNIMAKAITHLTGVHRVLLVEDHEIFAMGFRACIHRCPNFELVGDANNGVDGLMLARELKPDILLLHLGLPQLSGTAVTQVLRATNEQVKIVWIGFHPPEDYFELKRQFKVQGFIHKACKVEHVCNFMVEVASGQEVFWVPDQDNAVTTSVSSERSQKYLSPRQKEVVVLVAQGLTSKEIAGRLNLSPRTIETYRENIGKKLHLRNAAELSNYAVRNRLF